MIYLWIFFGVIYDCVIKVIDYIVRDLKKGFKRFYEDFLCDEIMVDEDEMEDDSERFLLNGNEIKIKEVLIFKFFVLENEYVK